MQFPQLSGYEIVQHRAVAEGLSQASARRLADGQYVTVKRAKGARATGLIREYDILSRFEMDSVVSAIDLEHRGDELLLFLADPRIPPARERFRGAQEVSQVLDLGCQVAAILAALHGRDIVHLNVSPDNVLVSDDGSVTLAGFSVAHSLSDADGSIPKPIGDPRYMAPEQTGLMDHPVGPRADLYCLGATLFEWLTGEQPFAGGSARKLMHAHLTRLPHSLAERGVPAPVSRCVGRLMAKDPAQRYQSADEVRTDLQLCVQRLGSDRAFSRPLRLSGENAYQPVFPDRLYGRDEALATLAAALREPPERTAFVWVKGISGIGKSSLVRRAAGSDIRVFAGKCEQYRRSVPFGLLNQVIAPWLNERLSGRPELLAALHEQLGDSLAALCVAFPVLNQYQSAPVADAGSTSTNDSPSLVRDGVRLVTALTDSKNPLNLFLDDLQWADSATLGWLEVLSHSPDANGILIIGAYRSEEVDPLHPLAATRRRIAQAEAPSVDIHLKALSLEQICGFLADTLGHPIEAIAPLATELCERTQGNPFFLRQFCSYLIENRYLFKVQDAQPWQWELDEIRNAPASDNLIEFLLDELHRLPDDVQRCLQRAASIGHRFSIAELRTLADLPFVPIESALGYAHERGLVAPAPDLPGRWKFVHDRIHQAAYQIVDHERREYVHLAIGRKLAASDLAQDPSQVFLLTHHWNIAREHLEASESWILARLDLSAARASRRSGARLEALAYASAGCQALPNTAWSDDRAAAFELHLEWALCARLANENAESKRVIAMALAYAEGPLERAELVSLQMKLAHAEGRFDDAVKFIYQGMRTLGLVVPDDPEELGRMLADLDRTLLTWSESIDADTLHSWPSLTDPAKLTLARFLQDAAAPAYGVAPILHDYLVALRVKIGIDHGSSPEIMLALVSYAYLMVGRRGLYARGARLGHLVADLDHEQTNPESRLLLHFIIGLILHYVCPLDEVERRFEMGLAEASRTSESIHLSYTYSQLMVLRLSRGDELSVLREQAGLYRRLVKRTGIQSSQQTQLFNERLIACYQGHTLEPGSLDGPDFSESEFVASLPVKGFSRTWYQAAKLQLLYRFGAYDDALRWLAEEARETVSTTDFYLHCEAIGFAALTLAEARLQDALDTSQLTWLETLRARLQKWNESCPENFGALHLLLEAELAAADRDSMAAMPLYHAALEAAERAGLISQAALCNERAAMFHQRRGSHRLAAHYARDAVGLLRRWGAFGLISVVTARFEDVRAVRRRASEYPVVGSENVLIGHDLDVESILRASQAISAAVELQELLDKLMEIIALSSGADHCGLYLLNGESFEVAAVRDSGGDTRIWLDERPAASDRDAPLAMLRHVAGAGEPLIIGEAAGPVPALSRDYFAKRPAYSAAALPLFRRARCSGVVYLENQLTAGVFTAARLHLLSMLSTQMAIAIDNALMYQGLVKAQRVAEAASRAKDQFLAKISHELRTPLNGILGGAQLLQMNASDRGMAPPEEVQMVLDSGHELRRIIEDVLDVGGAGEREIRLDISTFEVTPLLEEVIESARQRLRSPATKISLCLDSDILSMVGDINKVRRILAALVGNAVKFSPNGTVNIVVERRTTGAQVWLHFHIEDDGIGIAVHDQERIFEPFEQADNTSTRRYGGAGLGLSISQRLCRAMRGRITVDSALSRGARFSVTLPENLPTALAVLSDGDRHLSLPPGDEPLRPVADEPKSDVR